MAHTDLRAHTTEHAPELSALDAAFGGTRRSSLALILLAALGGCGGGSDSLADAAPPDRTAPTLVSVSPAADERGVADSDLYIVATFDEDMAAAGGVYLDGAAASVEPDGATVRAHFDWVPQDARLIASLEGLQDLAGNPAERHEWSFTTGPSPTVVWTAPASGAHGVLPRPAIEVRFSEPLDPATVTAGAVELRASDGTAIPLSLAAPGSTAPDLIGFAPVSDLPLESSYSAHVTSALADPAGNPAVPAAWTFTTDTPATWARTYGVADGASLVYALLPRPDGGAVLLSHLSDALALDTDGRVDWNTDYGSNPQFLGGGALGSDGTIWAAGTTWVNGSYTNAWLLHLDAAGAVLLQRRYGASGTNHGAVALCPDGTPVLAMEPYGGGGGDVLVARLDASGAVTWAHSLPTAGEELVVDVACLSDGRVAVLASTTAFGAGGRDAWLALFASSGAVQWQVAYGGAGEERVSRLLPVAGGLVVVGRTDSTGAGATDAWILAVDLTGAVLWQRTFGGAGADEARAIAPRQAGGWFVAGSSSSFHAGTDAWLLALDAAGGLAWEWTYGAGGASAGGVWERPDGEILIACDSFFVMAAAADGSVPFPADSAYSATTGNAVIGGTPAFSATATTATDTVVSVASTATFEATSAPTMTVLQQAP
jgi:hypothetical protein